MENKFISFENVKKVYKSGEVEVTALRDASFDIEKGEICVIVSMKSCLWIYAHGQRIQ